jgi:hypothetical protein
MKMILFQSLVGTALLASSLTINASIIEVSYTGTINETWRNGVYNVGALGYKVGDSISGSLFINTDLAYPNDTPVTPWSTSEIDIAGAYEIDTAVRGGVSPVMWLMTYCVLP